MKRIIIHWTAGTYFPTEHERDCYHFLFDNNGKKFVGTFTPEAQQDVCRDGKYAQHTGGGNTGSVGVAMCGMCGFKDKNNVGLYPLTQKQCEACFYFVAELCQKYNIPVTSQTVLTHFEFGRRNPKTSSAGKIDIIHLPPYNWVEQNDVGSFIRSKVRWYLSQKKATIVVK